MKKQVLKIKALICLIGIFMIWNACQEELGIIEKYEVSFNIFSKSVSNLKNVQAYDLNDAEKVIITVQENNETPTDYTQYELNVNKLGDAFITKKIALPFGSYKITEFYIIDALDSIIFASPLEGSLMAQNVNDPLPILFDVIEKQSNAVNVEVISTENLKPEDFGLIRFPIIEVETFQFLINVSELGTDQILTADITIKSEAYIYSQQLDSIIDNIVTVKDGFTDYILTIASIGYQSYVDTLTNVELKQYRSIPIVIELESEDIFIFTDNFESYLIGYNPTNIYDYSYNPNSWGGAITIPSDNFEVAYINSNKVLKYDFIGIAWHIPSVYKTYNVEFFEIQEAEVTFLFTQTHNGITQFHFALQNDNSGYTITANYTNNLDVSSTNSGSLGSFALWPDQDIMNLDYKIKVKRVDAELIISLTRLDTQETKTFSIINTDYIGGKVGFGFYQDVLASFYVSVDNFLVKGKKL